MTFSSVSNLHLHVRISTPNYMMPNGDTVRSGSSPLPPTSVHLRSMNPPPPSHPSATPPRASFFSARYCQRDIKKSHPRIVRPKRRVEPPGANANGPVLPRPGIVGRVWATGVWHPSTPSPNRYSFVDAFHRGQPPHQRGRRPGVTSPLHLSHRPQKWG